MVTLSTKARPDPDVLFTGLRNGESVLLHLGTKTYYSLNETGTRIWRLLAEGLEVGEIGRRLEAEYDVTLEHAQSSVIQLVEALVSEKLVLAGEG